MRRCEKLTTPPPPHPLLSMSVPLMASPSLLPLWQGRAGWDWDQSWMGGGCRWRQQRTERAKQGGSSRRRRTVRRPNPAWRSHPPSSLLPRSRARASSSPIWNIFQALFVGIGLDLSPRSRARHPGFARAASSSAWRGGRLRGGRKGGREGWREREEGVVSGMHKKRRQKDTEIDTQTHM